MAAEAGQAAYLDIADQGAFGLEGVSREAHADRLADRAAPTIAAHQVAGADRAAAGVRGHAFLVLGEPGQLGVELDSSAQRNVPLGEDLIGTPLRDQPGIGIGRGGCSVEGRGSEHLVDRAFPENVGAPIHAKARKRHAGGPNRVQHPEIVEHLQGAGL